MGSSHLFRIVLGLLLAQSFGEGTCQSNPTIYRFSKGGIRGVVLSDGPLVFNESVFAVNKDAVRRSYSTAFRTTTPIRLSQNVAVLDVPRIGRVLVDTGSKNIQQFVEWADEAERLKENMEAAGVSKESIDYIFVTHAHLDHISGVVNADGSAVFPNAKLVIGRKEHEYWLNPTPNENNLLPNEFLGKPPQTYVKFRFNGACMRTCSSYSNICFIFERRDTF